MAKHHLFSKKKSDSPKTKRPHRRGTCIVEHPDQDGNECILIAEQGGGMMLLPGGRAERRESRMNASIRELYEETMSVSLYTSPSPRD